MNETTHGSDQAFADELRRGLSKREYFAACALQGLLSAADKCDNHPGLSIDAVIAADALIEALNGVKI